MQFCGPCGPSLGRHGPALSNSSHHGPEGCSWSPDTGEPPTPLIQSRGEPEAPYSRDRPDLLYTRTAVPAKARARTAPITIPVSWVGSADRVPSAGATEPPAPDPWGEPAACEAVTMVGGGSCSIHCSHQECRAGTRQTPAWRGCQGSETAVRLGFRSGGPLQKGASSRSAEACLQGHRDGRTGPAAGLFAAPL